VQDAVVSWVKNNKEVLIADTNILEDASSSLLATRVAHTDFLNIAAETEKAIPQLFSRKDGRSHFRCCLSIS